MHFTHSTTNIGSEALAQKGKGCLPGLCPCCRCAGALCPAGVPCPWLLGRACLPCQGISSALLLWVQGCAVGKLSRLLHSPAGTALPTLWVPHRLGLTSQLLCLHAASG